MSLKNILTTGTVLFGLAGIGGCSVEYNPNRFEYLETSAPENLWDSFKMEDINHNKMRWEAYQDLFEEVNGFYFDENIPEGTKVLIPDIDKERDVWVDGKKYEPNVRL